MADCHLRRLDETQRSALHLIGIGALLQILSIRRMVAVLRTFLYKLLCTDLASPLRQVLPPSQALRPAHVHPSRRSLSRLEMHPYQFEAGLPIHCRENCRRYFPSCAVPVWHALPSAVRNHPPDRKRMQTFKVALFGHLHARRWHWATSIL